MSDDLPIDIDYAKFLDWLVDRRRVSKGWHASLKAARVLLRSAADGIPADCSFKAPMSYHELKDALALLEDKTKPLPFPGARDTDMLNRYAHPTSRAWSSARSSYESGSAYLAEAAQTLVRAADVEAPAILSEMARLREVIADCARKEGPTTRAAAEARERFATACEEMGVVYEPGLDFERAVLSSVEKEAPTLLRKAVEAGKDDGVSQALAYYGQFVRYTCGSAVSEESSEDDSAGSFRTLSVVLAGDVDALVAKPVDTSSQVVSSGVDSANVTVDWGALDASAGVQATDSDAAGIDWGIEIDASGAVAEDGTDPSTETDYAQGKGGGAVEIDWGGLDVPAVDDAGPDERSAIDVGDTDRSDVTLADALAREAYTNNLLELRAFLVQRIVELSRPSDSQVSLVLQQSSAVPDSVRSVDKVGVEKMLSKVDFALDQIAGAAARRTLTLQSSTDAVERCARGLSEKLHAASRLERAIDALATRKSTVSEELRALQPKLDHLAASTRTLLKRTEENLTALYRGRPVHILGEINVVFPEDDAV